MKSPILSTRSVTAALAATIISFGSLANNADGAVTVNFVESGSGVTATFSGTIDLTALSPGPAGLSPSFNLGLPGIDPEEFRFGVGASATTDLHTGISGPTSIASVPSGGIISADSSTGDFIGILNDGSNNFLFVPGGFLFGSVSGSSTWNGATLASLGIAEGPHTWTWGTGEIADSLTITTSAIPEPSAAALAGIGALGLLRRRRRD